MSLIAIYLASPRAWGHLGWTRLDCLETSLALLRRYGPGVPAVIFHEDLEGQDVVRLQKAHPALSFEPVSFKGLEGEYRRPPNRGEDERVGSYGYSMMCRFFSGIVQTHPAVTAYTHHLRLDDDSYLTSLLPLDRLQQADYTYRSLFQDPHASLWRFTQEFLRLRGLPADASYTPDSPYTNFYAASTALWTHPIVREWASKVQEGCLHLGWDDAQAGSCLAKLLAPSLGFQVRHEIGFTYRHNQQHTHEGQGHCDLCYDSNGQVDGWGPPKLT